MLPDRIVLCGFMGAGKTKVGRALAQHLSYRFVDLDAEIQQTEERTIDKIFADSGESYFRQIESEVGCKLLLENRIVLALGGGAVTSTQIMTAVKAHACLIYLYATPDTLWERIKDKGRRPLVAKLGTYGEFLSMFEDRMNVRRPLYEQADITIHTGDAPVDETVAAVIQQLQDRV